MPIANARKKMCDVCTGVTQESLYVVAPILHHTVAAFAPREAIAIVWVGPEDIQKQLIITATRSE